MSPDEVIQKLKMMGINSSRATLLRYKEAGLIPKPEEGAGGRGVGRFSDYPAETVNDYFASYHVIKKLHATVDQAAAAREAVRSLANCPIGFCWDSYRSYRKKLLEYWRVEHPGFGLFPQASDYIQLAAKVESDDGIGEEMLKIYMSVGSTRFSIEWWEFRQIAAGQIDNDYIVYCDSVFFKGRRWEAFRGDSSLIDKEVALLKNKLSEIVADIEALEELKAHSFGSDIPPLAPLGKWVALYNLYPEMQLMARNAALIDYRSIRPITFDVLATGKLPEV